MAFCTRCGSSNSASARFCCHCGTASPVVGPAPPDGWQAVPATPAVPVAYVYPRRYKSVALAILLVSLNLLGDGLRDAYDPTTQKDS